MDANALLLFVDVVDAGSLAEAARKTGVPKSTISRKLKELEESLDVRLLQRTTRQIGLTDAGRKLLGHARQVLASLDAAEVELRAQGEGLSGTLRVTASVALGERILAPTLMEFMATHPNVTLDLVLDPARTDLIDAEIDVAIRVGAPDPKSPLIARRITEASVYLCASPAYLEANGVPESLDELRAHRAIFYRPSRELPSFTVVTPDGKSHRVTPNAVFQVNSHVLAREAARTGHGVAMIPGPFLAPDLEDGRLVRVMPHHAGPNMWVYAAFPSRELSAAGRAFVDFVATRLGDAGFTL